MRKANEVMILFLLLFFLSAHFPGSQGKVMGANGAALITEGGVHVVIFDTPYGRLYVNLPDDMALGDVISGQLTLRPAGQREKQKSKNLKKLAQHSLDVGGQKISAGADWGKWTIPEVDKLSVTLMDPKGKAIARTEVPVQPQPAPFYEDFSCQSAGVSGGMFQYFGEFDGDFSDTDGHIGDRELTKWAESPRKVILESPRDIIGLCTVTLKEGDFSDECEYRGLSIQAAAGKDTLLKGESTTLTFTVRGLEGLEEEIPLRLENKTANIVRMDGEGVFYIKPDDVQPGGIYTTTRRITGIMPGGFHISAAVPWDFLRCKHCTYEYQDLNIISDNCWEVEFTVSSRHCRYGEWGPWRELHTSARKFRVFPKKERGKLCYFLMTYDPKKDSTYYVLYHHNGKRWVPSADASVKKGEKLPESDKDKDKI